MPRPGDDIPVDEILVETTRARAGTTNNVVRWVLAVSLGLAILALSAIWIIGALTTPQGSRTDPVTNQPTPSR
mgnify:CR=1 FL=1